MSLKIYSTLTRKKENFEPLEKGKVKMYVCGPTVYDLMHVGNFRGAIFFNLVRNWLEHLGYQVTFVYNYTDIDDKIINQANEEGLPALEVSEKYIEAFKQDYDALHLKPHDHNPRCTEYIDKMVPFIKELVDKDHAYVVDGEVFYSIESFKDYGKLSGKNLEELEAGHRVDPDPRKKNPLDFVLWKPSKEGEPSWDSPWGKGRPGWHIECSTMNRSILGDSIDIHGGGLDLIFPHHENEVAQSEAATGKTLAKYWMHNNFIRFGDEKMSKSLGNVVKARDFMQHYHSEILKYMILSVHYRSFLNLADEQVQYAIAGISRIYSALSMADCLLSEKSGAGKPDPEFAKELKEADQAITGALNDDFNTPAMFAVLFDVVRSFNASYGPGKKMSDEVMGRAQALKGWIRPYAELLSLFQEAPDDFLKKLDLILLKDIDIKVEDIEGLIEKRNAARSQKDFKTADGIRDQLNDKGILLNDSPQGTTWEVRKGV